RPARRTGRSGDRPADRAGDRGSGGAGPNRPGGSGRAGGPRPATRRVTRVRRRPKAMAHAARGRTPGGEPGGRGEGRGRNGPAARSLREDLLWAASPRRRKLRHGGQHGEAGNRRGGRAGRGRSAQAQVALRTAAPSRSAALAACLSLACWHRPTPTPVSPVAVVPLTGLSEASGRLQVGLVGHDVLQHYAVEIDYRQRRVRLFDPLAYRYAGTGATVPFSPDADLPLLRAQLEVRGRRPIRARLLLDTGASGLCLILTTPFAEQHGLGRVAPAIEAPIGTGLVRSEERRV